METADTRNNATEEVGAVSMSPSTSLLAEAGSPCCLYYEMPYCVEYFGNGRWQRDSNWAEEEIADALSRVEEIKTQKWAKDARLIRMRFEIITVNAALTGGVAVPCSLLLGIPNRGPNDRANHRPD
jgi:hypothetical protein